MSIDKDEKNYTIEGMYKQFAKAMYFEAYKTLYNEQQAKDAVQEAFLRIINNIDGYKNFDEHKTKSYCIKICKNVSVDMVKKEQRINLVSLDNVLYKIIDNKYTDLEAMSNINMEYIKRILQRLPDKYSKVLELYYYNDLSVKEIAKHLNIKQETAKKRLQRARKKLNLLLQKENLIL